MSSRESERVDGEERVYGHVDKKANLKARFPDDQTANSDSKGEGFSYNKWGGE